MIFGVGPFVVAFAIDYALTQGLNWAMRKYLERTYNVQVDRYGNIIRIYREPRGS